MKGKNNPQIENRIREVRKDREVNIPAHGGGGLRAFASGGNHEMGGGRSTLS